MERRNGTIIELVGMEESPNASYVDKPSLEDKLALPVLWMGERHVESE
jgi:hypothetical protein